MLWVDATRGSERIGGAMTSHGQNDLKNGEEHVELSDEPPREVTWAPEDVPSSEEKSHSYKIAAPVGFEAKSEAIAIAEFWLNVADGDPLLALVRACERMSEIVDKESFGFRRGRSPVMPTGLLRDERLL